MWLSDMAVIVASTRGWQDGSHEPDAQPGGGRYTRSTGGLVGAMVVTVVAVVGLLGAQRPQDRPRGDSGPCRRLHRDDAGRSGRPQAAGDGADQPAARLEGDQRDVPDRGRRPTWHLGVLTDKGKYVGVEEALGGVKDLVAAARRRRRRAGQGRDHRRRDLPDLDRRRRRLRGVADRAHRGQATSSPTSSSARRPTRPSGDFAATPGGRVGPASRVTSGLARRCTPDSPSGEAP